jgi:hypothetical protein
VSRAIGNAAAWTADMLHQCLARPGQRSGMAVSAIATKASCRPLGTSLHPTTPSLRSASTARLPAAVWAAGGVGTRDPGAG